MGFCARCQQFLLWNIDCSDCDTAAEVRETLVDNKEAVSIEKNEVDGREIYKVKVAQDEMGKIIGRQGKIAQSIRTIMKSLGSKMHKRVEVEFVDD